MAFDFVIKERDIVLNMQMLKDLVQDNITAIKPFVELFLQNVPNEINNMQVLCDAKNWEELAKRAHHVKSSLSVIQVDDMHAMAQLVEEKAKQKLETDSINDIQLPPK